MKLKNIFIGFVALLLVACNGKNGPENANVSSSEFKTFEDSLSYSLGAQLGMNARKDSIHLKMDLYEKGYQAALDSSKLALADSTMNKVIGRLQEKIQSKQMAAQAAQEQKMTEKGKELSKTNAAFLAENKTKPGVKVSKTGLQYQILKEGSGRTALPDDLLKIKFTAQFSNGEVFDSMARDRAVDFPARGLFPGWDEAALLMKKGGKYKFVFPPEIAFRDRAAGPIPPNSVIIFNVELVDLQKAPAQGNVQVTPVPQGGQAPPPQPRK